MSYGCAFRSATMMSHLFSIIFDRHLGQINAVHFLHSRSYRYEHLCGSFVENALFELFVRFIFHLFIAGLLLTKIFSLNEQTPQRKHHENLRALQRTAGNRSHDSNLQQSVPTNQTAVCDVLHRRSPCS